MEDNYIALELPRETSHLRLFRVVTFSATKISGYDQISFQQIDENFWGMGKMKANTGKVEAFIYKQVQDDTCAKIYESLGVDLDLLELENPNQIYGFIESSHELLGSNRAMHLLCKNKISKRFAVYLHSDSKGVDLRTIEFMDELILEAKYEHLFVALVKR